MNNWLNKLERKYGRYGIPNLTNILVAGQILVHTRNWRREKGGYSRS